jgi:hypothetical protein
MEHAAVSNEREERELRRIGRRVAEALEPQAGRAIPAARRRLFDDRPAASGVGARWVVGLAAVGAVAAIALAVGDDPAEPVGRSVARGGATATEHRGGLEGVSASAGSRARVERRADGAAELVLEHGTAKGVVGAQSSGPRAVVAGPYRVTGDAEVEVTWGDADGLVVRVTKGEARVLSPGRTPTIVAEGATKHLPAKP